MEEAAWARGCARVEAQAAPLYVVDCHAGGEPARVVIGGLPDVEGGTMLEKRATMMRDHDALRRLLIEEPRGYPCQNVDFVFQKGDGTFGFVIGEQKGIYPLMSGHNTICVCTALLEFGLVPMSEPVTRFSIEVPLGALEIVAECAHGKCVSVAFTTGPAFVEKRDAVVQVPEVGAVTLDIAFGGMWYAIVDVRQFSDLDVDARHAHELCRRGEMIKVAAQAQHPVQHPIHDYPGPDILVFTKPGNDDESEGGARRGSNAVVMSNGQLDWAEPSTWTAMLDRSACGTGTCAVMVAREARGALALGEAFVHESIVGSTFTGKLLLASDAVPNRRAFIPEIRGSAWVTQCAKVLTHPTDPFSAGFRLADIWSDSSFGLPP